MDASDRSIPPTSDTAISKLEAHLNRLERKLDRALSALEKLEAKEQVGSGQGEQDLDGVLHVPRKRSNRTSRQKTKRG